MRDASDRTLAGGPLGQAAAPASTTLQAAGCASDVTTIGKHSPGSDNGLTDAPRRVRQASHHGLLPPDVADAFIGAHRDP